LRQARANFRETSVPSKFAPVRSQAEVAEILGLSQSTVSETEERAIHKLRAAILEEYGSPKGIFEVQQ